MSPIIFLDIDGVLNSTQFVADNTGGEGVVIVDGAFDATAHIDPARVLRLNALIEETGASVVLSSSWRMVFGVEKTQASLRAKGFAHAIEDATPRLRGEPRHVEIASYLASLRSRVSFVVLDDEEEAGVGFGRRFIHVTDGLEDEHVDRAKRLLASVLPTTAEVEALLVRLGAPPRLLTHGRLVGEAAEALLARLGSMGVGVDTRFVRLGVAVHDAGKILHPRELDGPGAQHEPDGERLLIEHGIAPEVARCCLSHARWPTMTVSFEELLVALADKLWKGVRHAALEKRVVEGAAATLGRDFWEVFVELDTCFEQIAASAEERLARSR